MQALDTVEFLARSANRVHALELLSVEAYGRRELTAEMGVSKATVNRILDGFEEQGWITTDGEFDGRYRTTPPGALMCEAFGSLLKEVEQARKLAVVLRWLPAADLTFDPARLADATITLPEPVDSIAPVHRVIERMRSAAQVRLVPVGYVAESLRANRNAVIENGQSFEAVFETEILDSIAADPTGVGYLLDLLEAGCDIYHRVKTMPYAVYEADSQYAIGLVDRGGAAQALIETDDEVVGAWVRSLFETHRDDAERLDPAWWTGHAVHTTRAR